MNDIFLNTSELPVTNYGALCIAPSPFVHADRTADYNIMIYVIKGLLYVTEGEQDYEVQKGELLFLKSGIHHYGKKIIPQGTTWYYIHFYTAKKKEAEVCFQPYTPAMDLNLPIAPDENTLYFMMLPKKLTGLTGTAIEQNIKDFIDYLHSGRPYRRWDINTQLFKLLSECAFFEHHKTMQPYSLSDRIALYLQNHMNEAFKSTLLEKHFYLSYKHMEAVFKSEKNLSIQQYHTRLRLYKACDMLHSTELTICEISVALGFSDQLYFSRCFRRGMGMSPTEYRKKIPIG